MSHYTCRHATTSTYCRRLNKLKKKKIFNKKKLHRHTRKQMEVLYSFYSYCFVIILIFAMTLPFSSTNDADNRDTLKKIDKFFIEKTVHPKQNCDTNLKLCGTDSDCFTNCLNPFEYQCFKQVCTKRSIVNSTGGDGNDDEDDDATTLNCFPEKGVLLILHSDGKFRCTSMHPQLFDNHGHQQPYACQNGVISLMGDDDKTTTNLLCQCTNDKLKMINIDTPSIPRCYMEHFVNLPEFRF